MQGAEVTEMVIFICVMVLWALYLVAYFNTTVWATKLRSLTSKRHWVVRGMWHTAMNTRETWARDLMGKADDARGAALLAVQQMRNIIVSCTLLVMGMAQIMGRLVQIMTSDSNLATIDRLVRKDPMTGPASWTDPYVRVAVPFGATLVSLLCFGQAVRLAVHIGFNVRVQGISVNRATDTRDGGGDAGSRHAGARLPQDESLLLGQEVVVMLQRCELYFTLGLRFLYLFIGTIFWVLGTTALLVSSLTVLILLAFSDVLVVPTQNAKPRRKDSSTPPLWEASAELVAHPAGAGPAHTV